MEDRPGRHDTAFAVTADASGLVRLAWSPGVQIDREIAEKAVAAVDEINGDQERPLYADMTGTAVLTRGGRQVFTERCSASRIALVGRSAVDQVLANFSLFVSAPPVPTRFFTSETAAVDWLRDGSTT